MIIFENSKGESLRLDDGKSFIVQESDLRDFGWQYDIADNATGYGGTVNRFYRQPLEKTLTLGIRAQTSDGLNDLLNALHQISEVDIGARTPGRLYVDNQYVKCYLSVSSKIEKLIKRGGARFAVKTIGVLVMFPFWITEETKKFLAGGVSTQYEFGKKYNGRYPYMYGTGYNNTVLTNDHYASTPMRLTIYGGVVNPSIYIAGNEYGINSSAAVNERLVIDQLERTVYKLSAAGIRTNLFDYRIKTSDQFLYIPSGNSNVSYDGDYGFDITLFKQRSEPKWI